MKTIKISVAVIVLITSLLVGNTFANNKTYTEEEFKAEVSKEVERVMKRVGQGKIVQFSKELMSKENDLRLMEMTLQKREEELEISQKDLVKKLSKLEGKQQKLIGCLDAQDQMLQKRVNHMVDVISSMKPSQSAEVLSVQDSEIAIKILGKLEAVKVSKIFNLMNKEISARLQKQYMTMKK